MDSRRTEQPSSVFSNHLAPRGLEQPSHLCYHYSTPWDVVEAMHKVGVIWGRWPMAYSVRLYDRKYMGCTMFSYFDYGLPWPSTMCRL
jgi:hypothetical protein